MKKIIRLTESDLTRIVKRVIREQKETINIGDMYKITMDNGSHVRFKITSKENNESYYGTVLGVYGKIEPDSDMKNRYRAAKVGDPIEINLNDDGSGLSVTAALLSGGAAVDQIVKVAKSDSTFKKELTSFYNCMF